MKQDLEGKSLPELFAMRDSLKDSEADFLKAASKGSFTNRYKEQHKLELSLELGGIEAEINKRLGKY